jgi:hypothetical protein
VEANHQHGEEKQKTQLIFAILVVLLTVRVLANPKEIQSSPRWVAKEKNDF